MLAITTTSHLDHHLMMKHIYFILERFKDRDGFFAETIDLGDLPGLPCALRGPAVGMSPVHDVDDKLVAQVEYRARPGRSYPSRLLLPSAMPDWLWNLESKLVTVIAGPHEGLPCMLYTAFGGPLAPREPGDPTLPESERAASEAFWREHALVP